MPGALQSVNPPLPNPDADSGVKPGSGTPASAQIPAPTHAQTVTALRHFAALKTQLETALADPDLGKASMKSKIIDGMTKLVAQRMIAPGEAVSTLSTFPDRPFEQKTWLMDHLRNIMQARDLVLTHHAAAFAGMEPQPAPSPDDHIAILDGMRQAHYPGGGGNAG